MPRETTASSEARRVLGVALVAILLGLLNYSPEVKMGDGAEYLVLARSLADGGGFRYVCFPDQPPATLRHIGYPVILAILERLPGGAILPSAIFGLLCLGVAAALGYVLLRGYPEWLRVAAVALFLANPVVFSLASQHGNDVPYLVPTFAALLTLRWSTEAGSRQRWLAGVIAGLCMAAAYYIRPTGMLLWPVALFYPLFRRKAAPGLIALVLATALVLPWMLHTQRTKSEPSYLDHFIMGTGGPDAPLGERLQRLTAMVRYNAAVQPLVLADAIWQRPRSLSLRARPEVPEPAETDDSAGIETGAWSDEDFWKQVSRIPRVTPVRLVKYAVCGLLLLGLVLAWRQIGASFHYYVLFGLLSLSIDLHSHNARIVMHFIPFLALYVLLAAHRVGERVLPRRQDALRRLLVAGVSVLAVLSVLFPTSQRLLHNWSVRGRPWHAPERYGIYGADQVSYMRAVEWLATHSPQGAVLVCRRPFVPYLATGRLATWEPLRDSENPEQYWRAVKQLAASAPVFLIQDPPSFGARFAGNFTERNLKPAVAAHAREVRQVATTKADGHVTIVWQVVPSKPDSLSKQSPPSKQP
ncbi:MAG: hypothetical protein HPY69_01265 [Armatimonadetes bacterium]|nr:hypothetical protein [Armatimonadota bacterium]